MPRKAQPGINDVKTLYPDLMLDWDFENNFKGPEHYLPGSSARINWKCHICHNTWNAVLSSRVNGRGCPYCSGTYPMKGVTDLASKFPAIAREWHPTKNGELRPDQVSYASKKKVWWICPKGHEYDQFIGKRTQRGSNCPICSGHRTIKGINDFETVYPEQAKEWHPTKNGDKKPYMFSPKNGYKAWWMCKYGHEWQATIHERGSGTGCPYCKTRYSSSFPEQAIYYYVKQLCPDSLSRYKVPDNKKMEFDIYIPSCKVAIEFDGAHWHNSEDAHRTEAAKYRYCHKNKIFMLRVKEYTGQEWPDVADSWFYLNKNDTKELQNIIQGIVDTLDPESNPFTKKYYFNFHSKIKVDLEKDRDTILEYLHEIPNSLVELRPDLIEDWAYDKNGNLTPELFGINSNTRVWWRCHKCQYVWRTSIIHRAGKRNSGCPECSKIRKGKTFTKIKVKERGSLVDNAPELLPQWDYSRNKVKPTDITVKHNKPVWWLCDKCGYNWESSPNNRSKGAGCPCCSGRVPKVGVNDLKTINPALASEWNYSRNEGRNPEDYLPNSGKKAWWKCKICGHEWEAVIRTRNKGSGCPKCNNKEKAIRLHNYKMKNKS